MKLRIKELREENRLTQQEIADRVNNVQRNVSNWEKGVTEPDCETIIRLADVFNVTIDELFGRDVTDASKSYKYQALPDVFDKLTEEQKTAITNLIKSFLDKN